MSYIGGSQFSVDNRMDYQLFDNINRADMTQQIKNDVMPMGYTGRIQANSSANYARDYYGQLHEGGVNDRDISLYQYNGFKDDVINASSRATQSASRFNYAFDRQIDKRYIDVSGQFIPNNKLRVLPNRCCSMNGGQILPRPYTDPNLQQLSDALMSEVMGSSYAYNPANANNYLKYKSNRPKLTRADLMSSAQQYAIARPQTLTNTANANTTLSALSARSAGQSRLETLRNNLSVALPPIPDPDGEWV